MSNPSIQSSEPVVSIKDLTKIYDNSLKAVDALNMSIERNSIYALLGPNGAGKTTTISILTTLTRPSQGKAQVLGFDVGTAASEVRKRIGVTFQETVLDGDLTGSQALDFNARLHGLDKATRAKRISNLLNLVELTEAADRKISTYSGGMKRRLELARGLVTEPEILFLDEPTLGLDPQSRAGIWRYIRDLRDQQGMTILLTTHYLEEAQELADRVGIIDGGKLIIEGTPDELIAEMGADVIHLSGEGNPGSLVSILEKEPFVKTVNTSDSLIQIGVDSASQRIVQILNMVQDMQFRVTDVSMSRPSLDDVFLKYTGTEYRDEQEVAA
jgi:ABC-2 type transport system ATP-binding protein